MSRLRSWWTYLSLTLASALVGHLIFDALDDGLLAVVTRPLHLVYALVVLVAFVAATRDLYASSSAERRRRIALLQAGLRGRRAPLAVTIAAQLVLAATTLRLEDAQLDRPHLVLGALCALIALLVGACMLRRLESGLLRLALAAFTLRRREPAARPALNVPLAARPSAALAYGLFRPKRPPPVFA